MPRHRKLLPGPRPWLGAFARAALGVVWVAAAVPKAMDPIGTANSVRAYQLLPDTAAAVFGYALPWAELVLGALLLAGVAVRAAAAGTAVLMLVFIGGVAQAWARGLSIDCGCFGAADVSDVAAAWTYLKVIVRDLALLVLASWLLIHPTSRLALTDRATDAAPADPHPENPTASDPTEEHR